MGLAGSCHCGSVRIEVPRGPDWVASCNCSLCTKLGWRSDLALQDLVRRTGVEVDYRYKLESIDLWETVVMSNNKSALAIPVPPGAILAA